MTVIRRNGARRGPSAARLPEGDFTSQLFRVSGERSGGMSVDQALEGTGRWLDDRFRGAKGVRTFFKKIFPDHWTFLLGEIALYSFIILLLTGTFLTLFFKPSMTDVVYHGTYTKLDGVRMSEAYASTLNISFDVRGGLLMRRIHHWAADLFVAAIFGAQDPHLLHRRLPQAARGQLADRHHDAHAGHPRGAVRLLAARRPAVRHGAADLSRGCSFRSRSSGPTCRSSCSAGSSLATTSSPGCISSTCC